MPRIARYVVPDLPHHVTQHGNRRERVFSGDMDRSPRPGMPGRKPKIVMAGRCN